EISIHDPDSDYNILDDDSISFATATENSSVINNANKINEINLFTLDESALEGAKLLANEKESNYDDDIEWEDLDYESSEIASVTTGSTEGSKYLFDNCEKTEILTPCALLYIADNQVQRQGIGKKLFTCNDKHKDDTTQALELIGQWILNMAKLNNSDQKDELLTYLSSTLSFFDKTIKHEQNPPSLLFVKTAFQLGQVNLAKIMESDYNLTYKVSKKFGENLGTAV
ncbi:16385_t:CDS:2, partial [Gigaspora rosea]